MRLINRPSSTTAPENWPGLDLLAATVFLEADGEPELGQLAVAYNPVNRCMRNGWELHRAILGPDMKAYDDGRPYETYSCWNDDYRRQAQNRLAQMTDATWQHFYKLAAAAVWNLRIDPAGGSYFYLNVELTRLIRGGTLPGWWDKDGDPDSEIALGKHTFRRHR